MNCWKTVNFTKQYGSQRLFLMSSLTTLITFIFFYVLAQYLFETTSLYDNHFTLFIITLSLIYPLHKLLHYLPVAHLNSKVKKVVILKYGILPFIQIKIHDPISKWLFIITLFTPFVIINCILIWGCYSFPHYVHYFAILLAFHAGLCFPDLICANSVIFAPNGSYIEENEDGIEILLRNS